jgi:putative acetyltransferase
LHIRLSHTADVKTMLTIWLDASVTAHSFIDEDFWQARVEDMRAQYLPSAISYVACVEETVAGFLSLHGNTVAALFVSPAMQGQGIGTALLAYAKTVHRTLTLSVYKQNTDSVAFYRKHGFTVTAEQVDVHTGQAELVMAWMAAD